MKLYPISISSPILFRYMSSSAGQMKPLKIGLTGSIGMGKSTISKQFQTLGFPLFDADAVVHDMYTRGGRAVPALLVAFPDSIVDGAVDRQVLGDIALSNPEALRTLESIVHPIVAEARESFYTDAIAANEFAVVYDIPLLFEKDMQSDVDIIVVVSASAETQRARVLNRPGVSVERFESILAKQLPDRVKRERADYVISTDYVGFAEAKAQLSRALEDIIDLHPEHYLAWKRNFGSNRRHEAPIGYGKELKSIFDLVVFDLDDTLAPVMGAVSAGNMAMIEFMKEHMVETSKTPPHEIRSLMKKLVEDSPLIAHDFSELRAAALRHVATPHGEDHRVEDAVKIFSDLRSDIDGYLYADVLPCLGWLREENIGVGVFTNSNAAVSKDSVLGSHLDIYLHAGEVGASKPSSVPFMAISQRAHVNPGRILYVGDSYENDVVGAHNAGMITAYLKREGVSDETFDRMYKECGVSPDVSLNTLHPSELSEKLKLYIDSH